MNETVNKFPSIRLLVIGDLMLDEYIVGEAGRISPEAPVPVVAERDRKVLPGGAANVALNVHALEGEVCLAGVVGDDEGGGELLSLLGARGIDASGVVTERGRITTRKTRVVASGQQLVRLDRENSYRIDAKTTENLLGRIEALAEDSHAVMFSDYDKGVASPNFIGRLTDMLRSSGKPLLVDAKPANAAYFRGVKLLKPNRKEAAEMSDHVIDDVDSAFRAACAIMDRISPELLLLTLGADGMLLCDRDGQPRHIPVAGSEVFDITGAGDTVLATIALALSAGADPLSAAKLANAAAGVVIRRRGAATLTRDELTEATP